AAGPLDSQDKWELVDLVATVDQFKKLKDHSLPVEIKTVLQIDAQQRENIINEDVAKVWKEQFGLRDKKLGEIKETAKLRAMPWNENRGPNPYLLVTGQV